MRRLLVSLLVIFTCFLETGAVECNDGCATVTDVVSKNGTSLNQKLPEGLKKCSKKALTECGDGQVCVSIPVEFSALVTENGKTLENSTVKFVYSTCSGEGDTKVDCNNIGDQIIKQFNGTEYAKGLEEMKAIEKNIVEVQKEMDEMSERLSKSFEMMRRTMEFGFNQWPSLFSDADDDWLSLEKRDEAAAKDADDKSAENAAEKPADKAAANSDTKAAEESAGKAKGSSSSSFRFHSMILSGCKESKIKAAKD